MVVLPTVACVSEMRFFLWWGVGLIMAGVELVNVTKWQIKRIAALGTMVTVTTSPAQQNGGGRFVTTC